MAEPIIFPSTTPIAGLPLLFSGQSQKEFTLNQCFAILYAFFSRTVEATLQAPPASPETGVCYIVAAGAAADWAGRDNDLAMWIGSAWHFVSPVEGLEVYDRSLGLKLVFGSDWTHQEAPQSPSGGTVVDIEARAAIDALMLSLHSAGIIGLST